MTLEVYKSHKRVEAGKIQGLRIAHTVARPIVTSVIVGGREYEVPPDFNARGTPEIGDYLVRYAPDGYLSWSPRAVFEDGYALMEDATGGGVAHKESVQDKPGDVRLPIEPAKMGAKSSM